MDKKMSEIPVGSTTLWQRYHSRAVFSRVLVAQITKAMGYSPEDMQLGNVLNRLNNLGEGKLAARLRGEMAEWNRGIDEYAYIRESYG